MLISEVGPRNGLQSVKATMTSAAKWRWTHGRLEVGVRTFDASLGGMGGCPCAPGASGNVATEDRVFVFEAMGVATGVNIDLLLAARAALMVGLPGEPVDGMTPEAGMPKGVVQGAVNV